MKILMLGGTAFLGRRIALEASARGHEVTCLARGRSPAPEGIDLIRADRDEEQGLAPVAGTHWDAVIDVSRQPVTIGHHSWRVLAPGQAPHRVGPTAVTAEGRDLAGWQAMGQAPAVRLASGRIDDVREVVEAVLGDRVGLPRAHATSRALRGAIPRGPSEGS